MAKAMDGLMARHNAISSNLANVDTPGYKPYKVDFEDRLQQAVVNNDRLKNNLNGLNQKQLSFSDGMLDLKINNSKHFGAKVSSPNEIAIKAYQDDYVSVRTDANSVDIDAEMTDLAKTSMQFEALARLQGRYFAGLKETIKTGGQV
jgi:flagellar basal-body rod protein FlgB